MKETLIVVCCVVGYWLYAERFVFRGQLLRLIVSGIRRGILYLFHAVAELFVKQGPPIPSPPPVTQPSGGKGDTHCLVDCKKYVSGPERPGAAAGKETAPAGDTFASGNPNEPAKENRIWRTPHPPAETGTSPEPSDEVPERALEPDVPADASQGWEEGLLDGSPRAGARELMDRADGAEEEEPLPFDATEEEADEIEHFTSSFYK